jgi:hypothetical protein
MNDLFIANLATLNYYVIEYKSNIIPSPRKGSCLAAYEGFFLLFGGIAGDGYSNELWKFDWGTREYELLSSLDGPPPSAYSNCRIYKDIGSGEVHFQVYMGEMEGVPTSFLYEYNLKFKKWTEKKSSILDIRISRSQTSSFIINNKLVVIGGVESNYIAFNEIKVLNLDTGEVKTIGYIPEYSYYAASTFYKNKIYIHGGGYSFGSLPYRDIKKNNLIVINLNEDCEIISDSCIPECSKGTYNNNGECEICPAGSYSDTIGAESCKLCPIGYFSDVKGADSSETCKLCTNGYFGVEAGQSRCYECPYNGICSYNSQIMKYESSSPTLGSIQPKQYEYKQDTVDRYSNYFDLFMGLFCSITIVILLSFFKYRRILTSLDLYSQAHNYEINKELYMRKTLIGGIATMIFFGTALSIIFKMTLAFYIDNIIETKALVPAVALEQDYETVINILVSS